jgi:formate C-acetyltransferase
MILQPDNLDALPAMQRIAKLREECVQAYENGKWRISMIKAQIITASYQQSEGEHPAIRRALAIKAVFQQLPIPLSMYQLLAGTYSSGIGVAELHPESLGPRLLEDTTSNIFNTIIAEEDVKDTIITAEDYDIFAKEIRPYWKDKAFSVQMLKELKRHYLETWTYYMNSEWSYPLLGGGLSHTIQDYIYVAQKGLIGIKDEIQGHIAELDAAHPSGIEDFERRNLYEAMIICADGLIEYAQRCADHAEALAQQEMDPQRVQELTTIAAICRKVPVQPAETFWETLQAIHFLHLGTILAEGDDSNSFGNFDQYMYPILQRDLENGTLTLIKAQELLECFFCKRAEARVAYLSSTGSGRQMNTRIDIGGQDAMGRDQTNLLTRMCLEAHAHVHLLNPCLSFRLHKTTKDASLRMALEVVRLGGGFPYILGDDAIITGLLAMGIPLHVARNYGDIGCQEVLLDPNMVPGIDSNGKTNTGFTNMVKPIELALWNGYNPVKEVQAGPETGDPRTFSTFAEFKTAVKTQFETAIRHNVINNNVLEAVHARIFQHIFHDLMHPGPRNSGIDINAGGCVYNWAGNLNVGTANAGDIMTAIDYLIYETQQVTWDELLDALEHNWEDYEALRQQFLKAPKYGTDDPYADDHTREILNIFFTTWESFTLPRPFNQSSRMGPYTSGLISMDFHMIWGKSTGATPDGRKAGEPFAAGCSPSNHAPALGPTTTHLSVARSIDTAHTVNGIIFNQKFNPTAVMNTREMSKWMDLVRTYVELGGQEVNYDIVARETLLNAQVHPEQYRDLWVRVGGYSARFTDLSTELQDEIIARAELGP